MAEGPAADVVEQVEQVLTDWVYPQRKALSELVKNNALTPEEVKKALRELTVAAAQTLKVDRCSVWQLRADGSGLDCIDLYEKAYDRHSSGLAIEARSAPAYFRALATERVIAAHDAHSDPRTSEFSAGYLGPVGIGALLDAPSFVQGRATAVLCHEHVGPARKWQFWEELVASTFADFVALVFETEARSRDSAQRRAYQEQLERDVKDRTAALTESEQNLQALLDASPVALVLTRASDHQVVYANPRASVLFDVPHDQTTTLSGASFWVDEGERQSFLKDLLSKGRVDGLQVRLKAATGRIFWARLNAQAVRYRSELTLLSGIVDVTQEYETQANLKEIFTSAPLAMVISRLDNQMLLDGNQSAEHLFGISIEEGRGRLAPDYWVEPAERVALRDKVRATGRVDGFEARLRTAGGREFWAELSATVIRYSGAPALLIGGSDITRRKQADEALRKREQMLRMLLEATPTSTVVTGVDDAVVRYCNAAAAEMFELPASELLGRRTPDFYVEAAERMQFVEQLRRAGHVAAFTTKLRTSKGRQFWALLNATAIDFADEPVFIVGIADLSAQKETEARLRQLATTDELTQVFNRRHFFELGTAELSRASRYGSATSLAMLDIDFFKRINDELGHAAGDAALKAVAMIVREQVRSSDIVGRIGGEEFAILFPETSIDVAAMTIERLRREIGERSFAAFGLPADRRITGSFGVVQARENETISELLRRADASLYESKADGRNRVTLARA